MSKHILALDPSGAYDEGKGTTGWCLMDQNKRVLAVASLKAKAFRSPSEYWAEHTALIDRLCTFYDDLVVVIEDYLLYANEAQAQINSRFETVQLIGIIKHHCYLQKILIFTQTAAEVKKRWANDILVHKRVLCKVGQHFIVNDTGDSIDRHAIDSIRHAMHFATFYNK